jgi:hypothetical protein
MHPVPGGIVAEREQLVQVIGDLRDGLGEPGPAGSIERLRRGPGVVLVLGTPDPGQGLLRARMRRLRQRGENVRGLAEPAALLFGLRKDLACQARVSFVITGPDRPAPEPGNWPSAGTKSPGDRPCRYSSGSTSVTFGVLRAQAGKTAEANRCRSPVTGSVRLSFTRGAVTWTAPALVSTSRRWWQPFRTTSRRPFSSRSPANCAI